MFFLKSHSPRYLGNSADFHTAEHGAAQNLSAWFAPRRACTLSWRPGGNLRGHSPLVFLQSSNHKTLWCVLIWLSFSPPPPPQIGERERWKTPYCCEPRWIEAIAQMTSEKDPQNFLSTVNELRDDRTICCSTTWTLSAIRTWLTKWWIVVIKMNHGYLLCHKHFILEFKGFILIS